jgi:hypothetical protein
LTRSVVSRAASAENRLGPSVRLFVEEGKIRARGKAITITAMLGFALTGVLAIPPIRVKIPIVSAACAGSLWVALRPGPDAHRPERRLVRAATRSILKEEP